MYSANEFGVTLLIKGGKRMKMDRLLGILSVLGSGGKVTVAALAERFEVSRRTIFRDLDSLSRAGIPIVSYPGLGGGVTVAERYKLETSILSRDDLKNLFTALHGLDSIEKSGSLNGLMAKLLPEGTKEVFSESDYLIDLSSWFQDSITKEKVSVFHGAIVQKNRIWMEYISASGRSERIVQPHKLVFKQSDWYLYAYCEKREEFRLFRLSRVAAYRILESHFVCKPIYNIAFWEDFGRDLFSSEGGASFFEVVMEYGAEDETALSGILDAKFFHRNVEQERGQIRFFTSNLDWAADLAFRFQDKVKILEPEHLKNRFLNKLDRIRAFYKR